MEYIENLHKLGTKEWFMFEAYKEAMLAYEHGECPIGAVIVRNKEIIARAHNLKERDSNPLGHAEVIAIKRATEKLANWRLEDCDMYVTLEPCTMCAGALILARIRKVYIGASDFKSGAVESISNVLDNRKLNHTVEYEFGVLENSCSSILKDFFRELREKSR